MITRAFVITQAQEAWLETQASSTGDSKSEILRIALEAEIKRQRRRGS